MKTLLIALPVTLGLLATTPAAHAEWRHGFGGGHWAPHGEFRGHGPGGLIAGMLLGLGAAAVTGAVIASQPVYAQPVYAQPVYQAPPVVYAPAQGYYR